MFRFLLLLCLTFLTALPALHAEQKPNIVLTIADDLTWYDIGCYGNPDIHTPNLDRLASEGMKFNACFTSTAMCAPTRQQLYTGLYPVRNGAYPNHSRVYPGTKSIVHAFKKLGYRVGLAGKTHFGPADSFPFEKLGGKDLDFEKIAEFVNRNTSQPYLLVVASNEPHKPWSRGDRSRYSADKLTIPPFLHDTPVQRAELVKYYAEISYLDQQVGQCLKLVDDSGQADNTIFLFTSEQGSQMPFGKWTCYDLGLKTGLLIRWPGKIQPGSSTSAMVQYVDVLPTLLEAVGAKPNVKLDGKSFWAVALGKTDQHREHVFGIHTTRGIINGTPCYPIRSVRSATFKYIVNLNANVEFTNIITKPSADSILHSWQAAGGTAAKRAAYYQRRPVAELYDLRTDPWEQHNLINEPRHQETRDRLHNELTTWMSKQGDLGVATELNAHQRQGRGEKKPAGKGGGKPAKKQPGDKAKPT